jgi:hypothetical protein
VIVHGRFTKPFSGNIKLRGKIAGQPYEREIAVNLPASEPANDSLASLWARTRIDELSSDKLRAANPAKVADYEKEIANLGLEFRLLTNFTSFVAVEDRVVNQNGKPVTIQVPAIVPEGVDPVKSGATVDVSSENASVIRVGGAGGGGGLQTTNSTPSTVGTRQLNSLPVNGRSTADYLTLTSGVAETVTVTGSSKASKQKTKREKSLASGTGNGYGSGSGNGTGSGYGNGTGSGDGAAGAPPPPKAPKTAAELRDDMLKSKMHSWVYALMSRLKNNVATPAKNESQFVREGKASVELDLSSISDSVRAKLKAAGFEILKENKTKLSGRISIDKLASLADVDEVKLILPLING